MLSRTRRDGLPEVMLWSLRERPGPRLASRPGRFAETGMSGQQGVLPRGQLDGEAVDDDRRAAVLVEPGPEADRAVGVDAGDLRRGPVEAPPGHLEPQGQDVARPRGHAQC